MLGPARFDHIKNCARAAILRCTNPSEQSVKKIKIEEGAERRDELIRILPERDQSIMVLRGLLAEKQQSTSSEKSSPAKVPEYATLPRKTLENLERARDATIGWILQQIEKAEAAEGKSTMGVENDTSKSQKDSRQTSPPAASKPSIVPEAASPPQPPAG